MKPSNRKLAIISATAAVAALSLVVLVLPIGAASSQQPPMIDRTIPGHGQMQGMMMQRHQGMMPMHGRGETAQLGMSTPTMPGQDAFGAVQEIVRMLEADPETDWSKVDLEALRQHLIDMNEVTLKADTAATQIEGGLEIAVSGSGRTLAAIQRMVTAHAQELNQMNGWSARSDALPDGTRLTVTSNDPKEVAHIRGLGLIGSHHQPHHLAMAKGEIAHAY